MKTTRSSQSSLPWYVTRPAWPVGVILLALFIALAAWLLKPRESIVYPSVTDDQPDLEAILSMQQQRNRVLRSSIEQTRAALSREVCEAGTDASPDSTTDTGNRLSTTRLHDRITRAVVLVIGETGGTGGRKQFNTGTGFFVSEDEIVTNAHVVDGIDPGTLHVYSEYAGKAAKAKKVATDYQRSFGGRDYALLRVDGFTAPGTLAITPEVNQLMEVVSAGYPGVYREVISSLVDLDQRTLPPFIMTDGIVSSVSDSKYHVPTLSHTAEIHGGNSGGPLVNRCGAVVGINTFTATPGDPPARINFALGGSDLLDYLSANGVSPGEVAQRCE